MTMTTARKPRGSYAKTAARRQEILDAAIEVFSASGFRNGSLRDVADRVGLSQAGLLHHYPSKEHLLQAVLAWRDEATARRMGEPAPEGLDLVRAFVALAEYNATTPGLVELHVVLSAEATAEDHPVHDYFVRRYERVLAWTQEGFESAASDGKLRPDVDCASAARTLIALMDGLQVQWLLHREAVDMAGDIRRYVQSLLTVDL
jgi:AcrR family transcriptional regulator